MGNSDFSSASSATGRSRRRVILIVTAIIIAVAVIIATVAFAMTQHGSDGNRTVAAGSSSRIEPSQSDGATVTQPDASEQPDPASSASALPFTVDGVPTNGDVVEVTEGANAATLADSWTFGGDFSRIGSFPVDASTVFGSTTSDPNDLTAYHAALLHRDGSARNVDSTANGTGSAANGTGSAAGKGTTFYEPQDGTGDGTRIVWRSSTMNDSTQIGVDNWRLQTWDAASGIARTLGTAAGLNGRDDTPQTYGEVVPTFNGSHAFFASNTLRDGSWKETVLSFDLNANADADRNDGADQQPAPHVVGEGNFPAAVDDGVLFAADTSQQDRFRAYATLKHDDGTRSSTVFTIQSDKNAWGISGVWAHADLRAVSFSDGTIDGGNYIGLWSDDFAMNLGWVHVKSPSVVASMNDQWIVWGSGSQSDNAGMYAFNWSNQTVKYLGALAGYSRPTIASDSNTVMVPTHSGSDQAVSFTVGTL